jgi:hypothetical protein
VACGFAPASYWDQTPRLVYHALNGFVRRLERENENSVTLVHLAEQLRRAKKIPKLNKLIPKRRNTEPMRDEDIAHALSQWAAVTNRK